MRLRIALLVLIMLTSSIAISLSGPGGAPSGYTTPVMNSLPYYLPTNFTLRWQWDNSSSMQDEYYGDLNCSSYPCFYYYKVYENNKNFYYSNFSNQKFYRLYDKEDGFHGYYAVEAWFYISQGVSGDEVRLVSTSLSNTAYTMVDNSSPLVNAASSQGEYRLGDRVFINALVGDLKSGINHTDLYLDGLLVNSSQGTGVTYSTVYTDNSAIGDHAYYAVAFDNVNLANTSGGTFSVKQPVYAADATPPNVTIFSVKEKYSNNETIRLYVTANDSGGGLKNTQVFVNNDLKCTNSSPSFVCVVLPFSAVQNGSSVKIEYFANATDNADNYNTTPPKNFTVVGNSSCNDFGTPIFNRQCASNGTQSFICSCSSDGCALLKKCVDVCYCPSGFSCNSTNQVCSLPSGTSACSDGTPYGQCSITLPKYCNNGTIVNNCIECGCPSSQICNSTNQSCYVPTTSRCSDGTLYGQCSIVRPKYCNQGVLIDYCSLCGCLSGTQCSLSNSSCFVPSNPEKYIRLELISPNAPSVVLSPGQNALFDVRIKDEKGKLVSNATVILVPKTMSYTSTNLGNGLYEIKYRVNINATGSFLVSIMATRGENETDTLTLQVNISRMLDIEFLNPTQNVDVTDSRQVEMKIMYPNSDLVLSGDFKMSLGNRTFTLEGVEDKYRGFLNISGESYGTKNISVYGQDVYGNSLDGLLVINYIERKDYTIFFVALLFIAGGSAAAYFLYTWGSGLSKDYKMLKKEKVYLETMDKRTHLEFFKRHIDESTFKKLVLEYQQKTTDVDKVVAEMEKRHRWLRWL